MEKQYETHLYFWVFDQKIITDVPKDNFQVNNSKFRTLVYSEFSNLRYTFKSRLWERKGNWASTSQSLFIPPSVSVTGPSCRRRKTPVDL